jgi:alkanesulfonate monooxygenase SsuD/methylene tetrahydromethanopterin reductase-like flavin-dependent oxidoreductase (luciferase family)/putative sterol carrier protein
MRFGLFYEHQMPRPWNEGAEGRLMRNALEQIELADRIGIDYVWEVEHHFLEEYSHSSAPEVFLAAASQRTNRIRLGHGIVQLPPAFNHPARIAERIATLDLVSNGRVDFGTGEASSQMELGGFGIEREQKRAQWAEAIDVVTRMFVEEPFAGYEGEFISVPQRNVVPKPQQKPHPPVWVACSRRETILLAGEKGIGALSFSFVEPEDAKQWVDEYYALIASDKCVPAGFSVNPNLAVVVPLFCHEDEDTAIKRGIDGGHFFGYSLAPYYVFGEHKPGRTNVWDEFQEHRGRFGFAREIIRAEGETLGVKLLEQGLGSMRGAVGTPEQITDLVSRYEAAGVDQVIFVAQCGNNVHEEVSESLELFGKEVLPRFSDTADEVEAAKVQRLSGAIEAAMARREPPRVVADDYLVRSDGEPSAARTWILAPRPDAADSPQEQFLSQLRGKTDEELVELARTSQVLELIVHGMADQFQPQYARGFTGDIQYVFDGAGDEFSYFVRVDDSSASAHEGRAEAPAVTITMTVPTYLRIVAGETNGAVAMMEGKIGLEGDTKLAIRLGEMFGQSRY